MSDGDDESSGAWASSDDDAASHTEASTDTIDNWRVPKPPLDESKPSTPRSSLATNSFAANSVRASRSEPLRKFVPWRDDVLGRGGTSATHVGDVEHLEIAVVGAVAVGKTSLQMRFALRKFTSTRSTIGADRFNVALMCGADYKQRVSLSLIDTAGQDRYAAYFTSLLRSVHAFVFVFDATRPDTLEHLNVVRKRIDNVKPDVPCMLVANKVDLYKALEPDQRWMDDKDMRAHAVRLGCTGGFVPLSAKVDPARVDEMFVRLCEHALAYEDKVRNKFAGVDTDVIFLDRESQPRGAKRSTKEKCAC